MSDEGFVRSGEEAFAQRAVEARRLQETQQAALRDAYRSVFDTPSGQVVLDHLCQVAHMGRTTFTPSDPHQTSFKEGQRHIVLSILNYIETDIRKRVTNTLTRNER